MQRSGGEEYTPETFEELENLIKEKFNSEDSQIVITVDITTQNNPVFVLKIMEDYGYTNERSQREKTSRIWEENGQERSGLNTFDFSIYYNKDEGKYKLKTKNDEYMNVTELETIYKSAIMVYQPPESISTRS